jgi:hypothetical protein
MHLVEEPHDQRVDRVLDDLDIAEVKHAMVIHAR